MLSISSRLDAERQVSTSVPRLASAISPLMKSRKRSSCSSMTKMFFSTIMHSVRSSEYSGLKLKPSAVKKAFDVSIFFTGRLTKIMRMVGLLRFG